MGVPPNNQNFPADVLVLLVPLDLVIVASFLPLWGLVSAARSVASQSISGCLLSSAGGPSCVSFIDGSVSVGFVSVGAWEASPSVAGSPVIASVGGEEGTVVTSVSSASSNLVLFMVSSMSRRFPVSFPTSSDDAKVEGRVIGAEVDWSDRRELLSVGRGWRRLLSLYGTVLSSSRFVDLRVIGVVGMLSLDVPDRVCRLLYILSGTKP